MRETPSPSTPAPAPASPQSLRIAVLDRDSGFLTVLGKRLERAGWEYRVLASSVAPEAIVPMRLAAIVVDLAVIGADLAGMARAALRRAARARRRRLHRPARRSPSACAGLRLGADDWLTKPCHPEELIARVESVVRRRRRLEAATAAAPMLAGEVEIHRDQYQAFVRGASIDLTRREFELIELLASSGGRVLEREFIYQRLWGYAMVRGDRSVDVFVRKLRQKLERVSPAWRYIHTHFGIGYRFAAEPRRRLRDGPPGRRRRAGARVRAQR